MKRTFRFLLLALTATNINYVAAADLKLRQLQVSPATDTPNVVLQPAQPAATGLPSINSAPTNDDLRAKTQPTHVDELADKSCISTKPTFDSTSGTLTLGGTVTIYGTCLGTPAGFIGENRSDGNILECLDIYQSKNSFALPIAIQSWENTKIVISASKLLKTKVHGKLHKCNLLVFGSTANNTKIEKNQKLTDIFFTVHFEP